MHQQVIPRKSICGAVNQGFLQGFETFPLRRPPHKLSVLLGQLCKWFRDYCKIRDHTSEEIAHPYKRLNVLQLLCVRNRKSRLRKFLNGFYFRWITAHPIGADDMTQHFEYRFQKSTFFTARTSFKRCRCSSKVRPCVTTSSKKQIACVHFSPPSTTSIMRQNCGTAPVCPIGTTLYCH